jgi:hypothetical protein
VAARRGAGALPGGRGDRVGYGSVIGFPEGIPRMTVLALSGGDIALIVIASAFTLLVLVMCLVLLNTYNILTSTKLTIDSLREETVPLLREVKTTVEKTNRELDRVDTVLESAGSIVDRANRFTGLVGEAASNPIVKVLSFGAGVRKGFSKVKSKKR